MRDADVRSALCSYLIDAHRESTDTMIVEEMGIWSGAVRVDMAVINGEIHGFELKSASDTLARLPAQKALYEQVFDRVTLVVAERHQTKAVALISEWWGVVTALERNDKLELHRYREAQVNPAPDPLQIARLLWREETLECLQRFGGTRGLRSATADRLSRELSTRLPLMQLRDEVRVALKRRPNWLRQVLRDERKMSICTDLHPLRSSPGC